MATNCFDLEADVFVCVDGPVGGGNTANLSVFVSSLDFDAVDPVGATSNWDGSTVTYTGWLSSFNGCSDLVSSTLTVTLVGTNEVEVAIQIVVNNCTSGAVYTNCGPSLGPHTFTDSRIVTMTGSPCTF